MGISDALLEVNESEDRMNDMLTRWWLNQPIWKMLVKRGDFLPQGSRGEHKKIFENHIRVDIHYGLQKKFRQVVGEGSCEIGTPPRKGIPKDLGKKNYSSQGFPTRVSCKFMINLAKLQQHFGNLN